MKLFGTIEVDEDLVNKKYVDDAIVENAEAFVAVYEQTTYVDVTAAIDANKVIMLDMPANHNLFNITHATYTNGGNAVMYAIFKMNNRSTLMTATLTPSNNWTVTHTDLQEKLESGTNIKTINNESLLGSGNINIQGGTVDQTYSPTSENAQSGKAVKEAFNSSMYVEMEQNDWLQIGISPVTSGKLIEFNRYNSGSSDEYISIEGVNEHGQGGTATVPSKSYVDSKVGMNLEVGKERWYGTYTDENGETFQVYSKVVYIPALPATAGITTYSHGVSNIKQILSIYGFTTDGFVLNAPRQVASDNITIYQASKSSSNQTFSIEVGKDRSNKKAYVTMIYAKNN